MKAIQDEFDEEIYSSPVDFASLSGLPGRKYWVALHNDEVVGTVGVIEINEGNAILKSMMVHRDYRGQGGTAQALLGVATNFAISNGCRKMYLGTMIQFIAAQKFYQKIGFTEIKEDDLPADFISNPVDKVFFVRNLD